MGLLINRAKAACNAAGTGAVTPGAANGAFRTWSASGALAGYWYDYLIEQASGAWEMGVGFYNGTTITRPGPGVDTWFESSTGSLLTVTAADTIACVANKDTLMAPAGGPFMPPMAASFSLEKGSTSSLVLTDKHSGLSISHVADNGLPCCAYRTLSNPSGDFVMTMHALGHMTPTNWNNMGLYLRDTVGGKVVNHSIQGGASNYRLDIQNWTNLTTFSSETVGELRPDAQWWSIQKTGTTVSYYLGNSPEVMHLYATGSITAWLGAAPTRVGICLITTANPDEFLVPYFSLTGSAV